MKVVQYSVKLALFSYLNSETWKLVPQQLSICRKIIRLLHWLDPILAHIELSKSGLFKLTPQMSLGEKVINIDQRLYLCSLFIDP
jgi:hypothetical protein